MIISNELLLRKNCSCVSSIEEVTPIITQLEEELSRHSGVGLAAPQIGIEKQVAIIRLDDIKINIINPEKIELLDGEFIYQDEGCLSFYKVRKNTKRSRSISFINNFGSESHFYSIDYSSSGDDKYKNPMLVVAAQHEIDHLFGKLFLDHTISESVKLNYVGRNDPCPCGSKLKFKRCCAKLNSKNW